jgi:hypothetical protein
VGLSNLRPAGILVIRSAVDLCARTADPLGNQPLHPAVSRSFSPDAIDLDDLAEAVRRLLGSGGEDWRDPDLLLKRRRVSHVMGAKEASAS